MIIRHSKKILEQLSEIENLIQKIESYMDENGLDGDRESVLKSILKDRETAMASRNKKEN